jgi:hypothetical protein
MITLGYIGDITWLWLIENIALLLVLLLMVWLMGMIALLTDDATWLVVYIALLRN